jgi:hypothetical protein
MVASRSGEFSAAEPSEQVRTPVMISQQPLGTLTGDIHWVRNAGDSTAISLHIYGTDVSRIGSSVRRCYDLPVQPSGLAAHG